MDAAPSAHRRASSPIPKAVREALDLHEGDHVVFHVEGGRAVLSRTETSLPWPAPWPFRRRRRNTTVGRGPAHDPRRPMAVTAFVDAKILVRHLTGDPADIAARATGYPAASQSCRGPRDGRDNVLGRQPDRVIRPGDRTRDRRRTHRATPHLSALNPHARRRALDRAARGGRRHGRSGGSAVCRFDPRSSPLRPPIRAAPSRENPARPAKNPRPQRVISYRLVSIYSL